MPEVFRRHLCAVMWGLLVVFALAGMLAQNLALLALVWMGAVAVLVITVIGMRPARVARLAEPYAYRGVATVLFAVNVAGVVLGLVPGATETSQLLALYFGLIGVFGYRALVANRPGPALLTVTLALFAWLPAAFVAAVSCSGHNPYYHRVIPLTEHASVALCHAAILLVGVLAAAAVAGFAPRTDALPDARLL
jgi:hypothetical protein